MAPLPGVTPGAPPGDKWNLSYACFFVLGAAFLLPWNSFIAASDYYQNTYPDVHIDRLFTIGYLPVNLLVLCIISLRPQLMPAHARTFWGLLGLVVSLVAALLLTTDKSGYGRPGLVGTLLAVTLSGVADALAQGALFGTAAVLRAPRYTQALVAGTAASGVLASLARCISKLATSPGEAGLIASAHGYFSVGALLCALSVVVSEYVVPNRPDVRAALSARMQVHSVRFQEEGGNEGDLQAIWDGGTDTARDGDAGTTNSATSKVGPSSSIGAIGGVHPSFEDARSAHTPSPSVDESPRGDRLSSSALELSPSVSGDVARIPLLARIATRDLPDQDQSIDRSVVHPNTGPGAPLSPPMSVREPSSIQEVFRATTAPIYAVSLAHVITLSIFPGVLTEDVSSPSLGDWYGVLLVTGFNIADLAGKTLTSSSLLRMDKPRLIASASTARLLLIPAFYLAARAGSVPYVVLLTLALGASHGYVAGSAMIVAPALVPRRDAEAAGNLMVLSLVVGLNIGAALSFLWLI